MRNPAPTSRLRTYVLPLLHVCACLAVEALHSGWQPIALADYPISTPAVSLAFHYNTTAFPFLLVMGTMWWYLLSRGGILFVDNIIMRREKAL
jgi:hypothetical protein